MENAQIAKELESCLLRDLKKLQNLINEEKLLLKLNDTNEVAAIV